MSRCRLSPGSVTRSKCSSRGHRVVTPEKIRIAKQTGRSRTSQRSLRRYNNSLMLIEQRLVSTLYASVKMLSLHNAKSLDSTPSLPKPLRELRLMEVCRTGSVLMHRAYCQWCRSFQDVTGTTDPHPTGLG